jgi:hypothetical protein
VYFVQFELFMGRVTESCRDNFVFVRHFIRDNPPPVTSRTVESDI